MTVVRNPMNPSFFVESKNFIYPVGPYEIEYEVDGRKIKEKVAVLVKKVPASIHDDPPEDESIEVIEVHDLNGKQHIHDSEVADALLSDPHFEKFALDALVQESNEV